MSQTSRRDFLRLSAAGAAAGALAPYAGAAFHPGGTAELKVGLIGCGGRGTGAAANALRTAGPVKLWAMADAFGDHLENSYNALAQNPELAGLVDVPPERRFTGLEGYRGVIESCDVVLLATTPHFRPQHVAATVAAGKHLFVEKPVATDAPGVRSVMDSARKAKEKGLVFVSGLCYRYSKAKQETLRRVHDGSIGEITAMQTSYNTGGLWHRGRQPDWSEMEYQVRNWYYFTWLSGDFNVEQHVHSLDKLAWAMNGEYPVRCVASGGRSQRTGAEYGNIFDHFNTVYEWKSGVKGFSSCRQWNGCASDVSDHLFGTRGRAELQSHRVQADGGWKWRWRSDEPDDMYQNEIDLLFAAIRSGEPHNDGEFLCKSTMLAIMARMSAYTGQAITWEQAWNSLEDLSPAAYTWDTPPPQRPVAVPGVTKFS